MTFENITEKSVLNAAGRLIDPGKKITMPVEYYADYKSFVDAYVDRKEAKIEGIKEYEDFIKNGGEKEEVKEEKVDLMEEVRAEEKAKETAAEKTEEKAEEPTEVKDEPKEEAPKRKAYTRRKRAAKKTDEEA